MVLTKALVAFAVLARSALAQQVLAHFMAQETTHYSQNDWALDIAAASAIGIDGFALNVAGPDYEVAKVADGFRAAEAHGRFSLLFSFDMSFPWQQSDIVSFVTAHAASPAMFRWKDAVLVTTFNGADRGDAFYAGVKAALAQAGVRVSFAPSFLNFREPDPRGQAAQMLAQFPSVDGYFNWWGWPNDVNANLTSEVDLAFKNAIKSQRTGPYIMNVSPWQFKELGGSNDWVELSDTLWKYRWEQAINEVKPDIVEIVSWNDYGESHYIADINPIVDLFDPVPLYVNGFEHGPWRTIAKYYIAQFKTGSPPPITEDQVVFWYRSHPRGATCAQGARPRNADFPADAVFALALMAADGRVTLDVGDRHAEFAAPRGVSIGAVPFPADLGAGQNPFVQVVRDGAVVKSVHGSVQIRKTCQIYNFNPFVGIL